jgi:hypothetical protein
MMQHFAAVAYIIVSAAGSRPSVDVLELQPGRLSAMRGS